MRNLRHLGDTVKRVDRIAAEVRNLRHTADLRRYASDFIGYVHDILGQQLTPQQEEIGRAYQRGERNILVPSGNSVGKCVRASELIPLADGRRIRADAMRRELLATPAGLRWSRAESNGRRPIYRITLESGVYFDRTAEHPFIAASVVSKAGKTPIISPLGWTPASDLRVGQLLACPKVAPAFGGETLPEHEIKTLAYMIGDGGMTVACPTFTQMPGPQYDDFLDCVEKYSCRASIVVKPDSRAHTLRIAGSDGPNHITAMLRSHGIYGKHSRDKYIPDAIFTLPRLQLALFLNRLYSTDGWAAKEIGFRSISERLCREVQYLLHRFGIRASLRYRQKVNAWIVDIRGNADKLRFAEQIGIYGKEAAVAKVVSESSGRQTKWRERGAPEDCYWERIRSVEIIGEDETIAICVPGPECYYTQALEHNSFLAACIALHSFDTRNPGLVLISAPNSEQVRDIIFKEMRGLTPGRTGWAPKAAQLFDAPNHWIKGYTAKDGTGFHGRHDAFVLVIFDEADGIPPEFIEAAESMADQFLCFYNPTSTSSPMAVAERSGNWSTYRLNCLDHPNVKAGLEGRPPPIPNAVKLADVRDRLKKWATPLLDSDPAHPDDIELGGQRWRLGPVAQARIAGIRPTTAANSVFSENLWKKMLHRHDPIPSHWPLQVGADMALYGDDFCSFCVRRGKCVLALEKHNGWSSKEIVARLQELVVQHVNSHEDAKTIPVLIDCTGGYGSGVVEYCDGFRFIGIHGNWKSDREEEYVDARSQAWFDLADLANAGMIDLTRLTPEILRELHEDLLAPGYTFDRRGRRVIQNHEVTKKAIGRSPDIADALSLAYLPRPQFFESYAELK